MALAGNPNTGKTALFNRLTGARAKVGNYPGITVDRHEGLVRLGSEGRVARLLDVPGSYSLSARSEEERIAVRAIAGLEGEERPGAVVLVLDGTQLGRNLYFALQVIELDLPTVVAVNLTDVLAKEGRVFDVQRLRRALGVPVVALSARSGEGVDDLRAALAGVLDGEPEARPGWRWEPGTDALRRDVDEVHAALPPTWRDGNPRRERALAVWALLSLDEGDELRGIDGRLRAAASAAHERASVEGRSIDEEVVAGRYGWIEEHTAGVVTARASARDSFTSAIDRVLLSPLLGFPIFLALMTIVFQALFAWADPAIGAIESLFAWLGGVVGPALPEGFLRSFVVDGLIAGVGGVLVFLPQILLLFLFVAVMEDTGYMARVAFLMDRIMKACGLHGRAFVPMMSGFACAIPAVMATRTIERERDRLLTMMVVPLMTCSARLPVYTLLIAALYPPGRGDSFQQGLIMAGMYLFATVVALIATAVLSRTVFAGVNPPLLLEMPAYRMPQLLGVLRTMWERSTIFVREAGTVILVATITLWALLSFPADPELGPELAGRLGAAEASVDNARSGAAPDPAALESAEQRLAKVEAEISSLQLNESYAGRLGRGIEPAIAPLGFDWKIGVGLIGSFAAREVFVSTMAIVYGLEDDGEDTATFRQRLSSEKRPDGSKVFTPLVCVSLMVFFALAAQCMSTIAVVKRETKSWRWPLFMLSYMTVLAWVGSFTVYQGGRLLGFE
ncbi:Ferrous iron transport protein B [Planctomycetes bacterium Pla86]|uniref:Ferrous iron transport protein B n=1 Tax=Engelhardtia mirabilis TaxID=2528011 RepID=A0A518BSZ7_9BACT|nr:Ferrous iron transport protein B [Planctomycetes bacterium Pla133]QDV04417.1 Ferrous iron transport protein B [Planctomycetes bacterium Pla86]